MVLEVTTSRKTGSSHEYDIRKIKSLFESSINEVKTIVL
jgi:hypothetical protein